MKINGVPIGLPEPITVRIVRGKKVIELVCKAILDYEPFNALVPEPKPPRVRPVNGTPYLDVNDKEYLAACERRMKLKEAWIYIQSLSATEGLVWDTVMPEVPDTWLNFQKEFNAIFTEQEQHRISLGVFEAQAPSERTMDKAYDAFFQLLQGQESTEITENPGPDSTESGEVAKD